MGIVMVPGLTSGWTLGSCPGWRAGGTGFLGILVADAWQNALCVACVHSTCVDSPPELPPFPLVLIMLLPCSHHLFPQKLHFIAVQ